MKDNLYILVLFSMAGAVVLVAFFIVLQMHNQNRILRQKRKLQEADLQHQKDLLESVITSQENERKRIGMDLHDEVGAALSTLRIRIDKESMDAVPSRDFFAGCKTEIDLIIENMRSISHNLSPKITGSFGFYDAIHELADKINRNAQVSMLLRFDETKMPVFPSEQSAMALYRVLTELVNNTLKHASAKRILLEIDITGQQLQLVYQDDGNGIAGGETPTGGMGIHNIESRLNMIGANWEPQHPVPSGYGINISVPVNQHA
jgi:signal transduction histidine kinase